jgi:hypothetical protein
MKIYGKIVLSFILVLCMLVSIKISLDSSSVRAIAADTKSNSTKQSALTLKFSKKSGVYQGNISLKITCSGSTTIYYTSDGSNPVTSATKKKYKSSIKITDRKSDQNYVSAVSPSLFDSAHVYVNAAKDGFINTIAAPTAAAVDKCTVIRAVAKDKKGLYTEIATNTYFIGSMADHIQGIQESCEAAGTSLAIISISVDYADMFDSKTGIYVKGDIFDQELKNYVKSGNKMVPDTARQLEANYTQSGKTWERSAHIDYLESNGETTSCALQQDCGIRIQGNYSRSDLQKSFRLVADKDYGEKNFNYTFFGDDLKTDSGETLSKFKTLVLRNGGNCAFTTKYSDTYWQSLMKDLDCDTLTSRPCVVYIDGEYWGLYVLQEDYTDDYFEDKHAVNKDDVVLYKGDAEDVPIGYTLDLGDLPEGTTDESYYYQDLFNFFSTHKDLTSDADYAEFAKLVDVESARDYFAAEIWINNKWDWPGKNWSMWKTNKVDANNPYADGKWRFIFYDVEFGGVSGAGDAYTNTIKEDNYMPNGLLDLNTTKKPNVLVYAYLMTNKSFRSDFEAKLLSLSNKEFELTNATKALATFKDIYNPLYNQFFTRYPGAGNVYGSNDGGFSSNKCINDFLKIRSKYIQPMIDYVEKYYSTK